MKCKSVVVVGGGVCLSIVSECFDSMVPVNDNVPIFLWLLAPRCRNKELV